MDRNESLTFIHGFRSTSALDMGLKLLPVVFVVATFGASDAFFWSVPLIFHREVNIRPQAPPVEQVRILNHESSGYEEKWPETISHEHSEYEEKWPEKLPEKWPEISKKTSYAPQYSHNSSPQTYTPQYEAPQPGPYESQSGPYESQSGPYESQSGPHVSESEPSYNHGSSEYVPQFESNYHQESYKPQSSPSYVENSAPQSGSNDVYWKPNGPESRPQYEEPNEELESLPQYAHYKKPIANQHEIIKQNTEQKPGLFGYISSFFNKNQGSNENIKYVIHENQPQYNEHGIARSPVENQNDIDNSYFPIKDTRKKRSVDSNMRNSRTFDFLTSIFGFQSEEPAHFNLEYPSDEENKYPFPNNEPDSGETELDEYPGENLENSGLYQEKRPGKKLQTNLRQKRAIGDNYEIYTITDVSNTRNARTFNHLVSMLGLSGIKSLSVNFDGDKKVEMNNVKKETKTVEAKNVEVRNDVNYLQNYPYGFKQVKDTTFF